MIHYATNALFMININISYINFYTTEIQLTWLHIEITVNSINDDLLTNHIKIK